MPSLETLKIVGVFYARFITIKESFSLKEQYGILLFRYYYLGNLFFFFCCRVNVRSVKMVIWLHNQVQQEKTFIAVRFLFLAQETNLHYHF